MIKKINFYNKIILNSSIVLVGILFTGFFGYIFHIVIARLLSQSEYAIIITLLSLITIICAPTGALAMIICKEVSALLTKKNSQSLVRVFSLKIYKFLIFFLFFLLAISFIAKDRFLFIFDITTFEYFLIVNLIFFTYVNFFQVGLIQAFEKFKLYSTSFTIFNILKIVFSFIFIYLGYNTTGVLLSLSLVGIIGTIFNFFFINLEIDIFKYKKLVSLDLNFFKNKNILNIIVANVSFIIITQGDILMVKFFFDKSYLDTYSPASVLSKLVLYAPSALVTTLFPLFIKSFENNIRIKNALFFGISLTFLSGLCISIIFYFFSDLIISKILGQHYLSSSNLLKFAGFGFIPFSIIYILEHYLISRNTVFFAYLLLIFVPVQLFLYSYFNTFYFSPIIINIFIGCLFLFIFGLLVKLKKLRI